MPLLPHEPYLFPDNLLTAPIDSAERQWWALHTRPRAEKLLARRLVRREVGFFLPVLRKSWRNRGRAFQSFVPLFPGYLFIHGDAETRIRALETNLVVHALHVSDQAQLSNDLIDVHRAIQSDLSLTPEERLLPGTPVEIVHGPLAGMVDKVIRRGSSTRFLIEVKLLKQGVSVDLEQWMILRSPASALHGAIAS
ncbi:MAG: UpxY family transcription antiterminator [Planctomycetes bacterium]|nr:UpxY family transcription antiterminator [Planctomycetota bacterium]